MNPRLWLALLTIGCSSSEKPAPPDLAPSYEQRVLSASWTALANGPKAPAHAKQDDLYALSAQHAFAVSGPASSIYETKDGGDTWARVFQNPGTYFRSILFADDQHGFVSNLGPLPQSGITDTNVLYQTADGGATWQPVTNISGPMPQGICNQTMIDRQHLVAVGRVNGPSFLMTSSDGGASWTSRDLSSQLQMLIDARFPSPEEGIVVGGSAGTPMVCTILHTSDGGASFQTVFSSATSGSLCWKISFPSAQVGYVSVQDVSGDGPPSFVKTSDGGSTWVEMPLPISGRYAGIGIGFITENIGWLSAEDDTQPTWRTSDGGMSWDTDAALTSPINRFRFVDASTAFAIGGQVWKLQIP